MVPSADEGVGSAALGESAGASQPTILDAADEQGGAGGAGGVAEVVGPGAGSQL